ncbi:MAG TPA: STAS domain-containing protein [Bacillales bacterium]
MELTIEKVEKDSSVVLYLKGILDITTTKQIDPYLEEISSRMESLTFDFSELELMDSTGIGSIMNAIHMSQEKQFQVKFQGVNELTHEVFEMVGLYKVLEALKGEAI